MRRCRFIFDDIVLTGYYGDNVVIPIDQAAEAYSRDTGVELVVPTTEELLDLLPPDGTYFEQARELDAWLAGLDVIERGELSIPVGDTQLLAPIAGPPKVPLPGRHHAQHV